MKCVKDKIIAMEDEVIYETKAIGNRYVSIIEAFDIDGSPITHIRRITRWPILLKDPSTE